ncbi:DNA polymerase IV [Rubrolithibacter danxiaensis]|uniref:DNA polymerase IV n=1 Tax=Rubrolithibacter danxiaensis TaxID=3390805 RepID=UPI003BF7DFAA
MEEEKRHIVHIDLDSFFVSVERLKNSSLNGKPVLIGGSSDRGVVASCSYEARRFGVHSAMPMKKARQLCPQAVIIGGDYTSYSKASKSVTQIIQNTVPLFEKTSIDEFYIDLTGMDKFYGCYQIASDLRQKVIKETGLPISFGLSSNKTVSKVATGQAKPNGQLYIEHGKEKSFLAPLSVRKIPMIGEKACETLLSMGIHKVGDLQKQTLSNLERVFGKMGKMMWEKANGIDRSLVIPYHERKSISSENTFHQDTADKKVIEQLLVSMTEQLTFRLRQEGKVATCLAVKIRYSNFDTFTQQITIPPTHSDTVLFPLIKDLFNKAYKEAKLIRLIGVRLSNLTDGPFQVGLFDNYERNEKLYKALDNLNLRFGSKTISRAISMDINSRDFNPFSGKD